MADNLIREIVEQILSEQILHNWKFYTLMFATTSLGSIAGSFLSSYARKRGEALATKADFHHLLTQLEATTKTAEEVKAAVQHSDWLAREWKSIRRSKLEALLEATYAARHWLDSFKNRWLFSSTDEPNADPMDKVQQLAALYFPELSLQVTTLNAAHAVAKSWMLQVGQELHRAGQDLVQRQTIFDARLPDFGALYQAELRAISDLENAAAALMSSFWETNT